MTNLRDFPIHTKEAAARSQSLTNVIRQLITESSGSISFSRFMSLALYHPQYGYYQQPSLVIGRHGDFTTAPEVSPLFAQCFANQCQQVFSALPNKAILEIGAGSGRFAVDLLTSLQQLNCLPDHYYIVDVSLSLREQQQALLKSAHPNLFDRIVWLDQLPEQFVGVIVANEVLDALPVDCFSIQNQIMYEKRVGWEGDRFVWNFVRPEEARSARPEEERSDVSKGVSKDESANVLRDVAALLLRTNGSANYESEANLQLDSFMQTLANTLSQGAIFIFDYGYGRDEYYHPERKHGTLTCFYQHQRNDNPLMMPGLQDITAHVNFTGVAESAAENQLQVAGYTSFAAFLLACGLTDLAAEAEARLSTVEQFQLHQAIKTLTLPTEMGERVKVMALTKQCDLSLLGFSFHDRRRDL